METTKDKKSGLVLILGIIVIGFCFQLLNLVPAKFFNILDPISVIFNGILAGGLAFIILKDEFTDWFKHFSFKWILLGYPLLFIISAVFGNVWKIISGAPPTANSINDVLSWGYVASHVPFLLIGEELLSITILYAAWKKLGMKFWQASLLCGFLFAIWHVVAYDFNIPQILITIIPSRLVLNYLFKKTNSIWVTWIVHIMFDVTTFAFVLLK